MGKRRKNTGNNGPQEHAAGHTEVERKLKVTVSEEIQSSLSKLESKWTARACILLALLALYAVYDIYVREKADDDLKDKIELVVRQQLDPLGKDISGLKSHLERIEERTRTSLELQLKSLADLPQNELRKQLKTVKSTLQVVRNSEAKIDLDIIESLQRKIAAITNPDPQYWATVATVINYASFIREQTGLIPNLKTARSQGCMGVGITEPKGIQMTFSHGTTFDCNQVLDGIAWVDYGFKNAVIEYRGGPVVLKDVTFENCIFEISLPQDPNPPARRLTLEILANNSGKEPKFIANVG